MLRRKLRGIKFYKSQKLCCLGNLGNLQINCRLIFFEFESLEFICYLSFVIWDLQYFKAHYFITA